MKKIILTLCAVLALGCGASSVSAQTSSLGVYVPLIGISSVPDPLALPSGPGDVTYHYAVKNFLSEYPLAEVHVTDDSCSPVTFVEGDDNNDSQLDSTETWRYICTTQVSTTTQSVATATGVADGIHAVHTAYATVVVGSNTPPPLVSIVNITKVAYPLSLPAGGGSITFTYRVNNPGVVPLSDVSVTDDKCAAMSGELGDRNNNRLLDPDEVWVYSCTTNLTHTTTNTATVEAYANGLRAVDYYTLTVTVATSSADTSLTPNLPNTGSDPTVGMGLDVKTIVWSALVATLAVLLVFFLVTRERKPKKRVTKR